MSPQLDDNMQRLAAHTKVKARDQVINTMISVVIGAGLAFWAYGTLAHMLLFSFVIFVVLGAKNALEQALHQFRASIESKMLMDKLDL
ncbi:putative membrane protein YccC [Shinella sp. BE166]|uniref:hypothetical protein n=1 Tax=Shinella sp. BE166 TaxID=3373918 RepID=UPI003EB6F7DC